MESVKGQRWDRHGDWARDMLLYMGQRRWGINVFMGDEESFFLFLMIAGVWTGFVIQSHRLYKAFLAKYPREAQELIPYAMSQTRHPEKIFFFFRRASQPYLKSDPKLLRLKRELVILLFLSVFAPISIIALLILNV
jgi:hypothetical protein